MAELIVNKLEDRTIYSFKEFSFVEKLKLIYCILFNQNIVSFGDFTVNNSSEEKTTSCINKWSSPNLTNS